MKSLLHLHSLKEAFNSVYNSGIFDAQRCPTDGSLSSTLHKKAGTRCTYEVTLLWLPPRPEDSISGLISGPLSEPASSQRGSLDTRESFDFRAPIPQAFPNLAPRQTSHKR